METESIVYFHPMQDMYKMNAAKKHWWESVSLQGRILQAEDAGGFFVPVDCPVPPFYYKNRPWPQEILSEVMEAVLHGAPGLADAFLHPQVMTIVSESMADRWEPRRETRERLAAGLIAACAADRLIQKSKRFIRKSTGMNMGLCPKCAPMWRRRKGSAAAGKGAAG